MALISNVNSVHPVNISLGSTWLFSFWSPDSSIELRFAASGYAELEEGRYV